MRNFVEWLRNERTEVGPWKQGWSLCICWTTLPAGTATLLWHWNKILKPNFRRVWLIGALYSNVTAAMVSASGSHLTTPRPLASLAIKQQNWSTVFICLRGTLWQWLQSTSNSWHLYQSWLLKRRIKWCCNGKIMWYEQLLFMLAISMYFNLTGLLSFHSINANEEKGLSQSLFFNYQMFWKLYLSE